MTNASNSSLYVSITLQNGTTLYELYQKFSVSGEDDNYRLYLKGPVTGTLGDRILDSGYPNDNLSEMYRMFNIDLSWMSFRTLDRIHYDWGDRMLDTGSSYLNLSGMSFSTPDRDNDGYPYNCAVSYGRGGGWWYNNCHSAYLNGPWSRFYWFFPWYPPLSD
ncbi:fibroleukin-like, partial [Saccostrea cucullata]|uniref:fibroleukin-like n=1 Tax=Saccostrea cuccullata TaxID=36930 RepID=UPI002ED1007A